MSGDGRFSDEQLKKCVKEDYPSIVCSFDPNHSDVLNKLYGQGVITNEQRKQISDLPTKEKRSETLVSELLETSQDTAISKFLEILHEEDAYKHISDRVYATAQKKFECENGVCEKGEPNGERQIKEFNNVEESTGDISSWDGITKKRVRECYTVFKKNLDPIPVLDKLFEKGVINLDKKQEIGCISNTAKCCEKLIDELLVMDEKSLTNFKDILKEEQPWLWNTIWPNLNSEFDRSLNIGEQTTITSNIHCFKELLKPVDDCETKFLDRLLAEECITFSQYKTILDKLNRDERISELFTVMLRRSFVHYQRFIKCLKLTYQHNMAKILESNGIVLEMHVDCNNSEIEKYLADIITRTAALEELGLQPRDKELIQQVLVKFGEKGIYIVGGTPTGSLIIYILCSTEDSVNELQNMFKNGQLKNEMYILLNSMVSDNFISDLDITIHKSEFKRGRNFFKINLFHEQQAFHCFVGGELNDMPVILVDIILKRASWIMWICFLIESLHPSSTISLNKYLEDRCVGFSRFVKVASSQIFCELSYVCDIWWNLAKKQKSFKRKLLSNILMTAMHASFKLLNDNNMHVRDRLSNSNRSFDQNLLTPEEKIGCNSKSIRSSNELIQKILEGQRFKHFIEFLVSLEQDCQHHLANHVMSFGIWLPCFGTKWPLDTKLKLIIASCGDLSNRAIYLDKPFHPEKSKQLQLSPEIQQISMRDDAADAVSSNLATLLLEKHCISADVWDHLTHLDEPAKKQMLWSLMEKGSFEMYEIIMDYFKQTEQNDVVVLLHPNQEVQKCGKHLVSCLSKATQILNSMIEKSKVTVSLLDHFEIKNHRIQFKKLPNYRKNEIILNILECSKPDVFIFFLNSLLATKQHVLLLPIFKYIPYRKLIDNFHEYLVNTINADSNLLHELSSFFVINNVQLETIKSKRTTQERNQELLNVISKTSPKSFNLFLTALVETGRSNILERFQLMHSSSYSDTLSTNDNSGTTEEGGETDHGNNSADVEIGTEMETDLEPNDVQVGTEMETDHANTSAEVGVGTKNSSYETFIDQYTIEGREALGSNENKKSSISELIFFVIKSQDRLPAEIRNILFLKEIAISKRPCASIQILNRHLSCLRKYVSEISDGIRGREVLSSKCTAMENNLSLIIYPEELKKDILLELRGYQKDLVEKAKRGLNCLIVAPTGSGKTIVALEISKHHMETGDARKVLFLVNKVPLVSQQYEQYVKYLPNRFRFFMLHGDVEIKIPISKIVETNDVIIMTPQVLLNALDEGDLKSLSCFTLMIFDECHHATKDHPYNAIMSNYFHDGTKACEQPKPQIIGLTASTGVGKAKSEKEAVDHILQLCANLNIFDICTVQGSENSVKVKKRKNDPFAAVISDIMQTIEQKMLNRPEIPQCIEKIPNFSCIQQPPSNRGSLQYVEYITKIKRPIASIYEQNVHRFFVVCRDYLEIYNRALQINTDCRTIDALKFIQSEIAKIRSKPVNVFDETDNWLLDLFTTEETELKNISSDPLNENPKLKELQEQILSHYEDNKDSLGIVFCRTRDMVQSLCEWMKETPELTWLNPNIAMGTGKSSNMKASSAMTKSKLEDVLEYFKGQKHKVLIATSVIEEGLDVAKCNYVIRYGHVTNDIARVQARGRARALNASYVLVGEEEGGTFERDRNNQIREEMMHRAIEQINMMPRRERNEMIREMQQQAKIEKETKLIAEEVRKANKRRDKCDGEYEIKCLKCSAFGIYNTDLRTIKGNQHVVIDDTFWSRINTKPHPEPRIIFPEFTKTEKISCKQCGMDWGIGATYKDLPCCVIKIQSFCVIHPDGKRIMYSRWKNVPFHIDEITTDDLESMSKSLKRVV